MADFMGRTTYGGGGNATVESQIGGLTGLNLGGGEGFDLARVLKGLKGLGGQEERKPMRQLLQQTPRPAPAMPKPEREQYVMGLTPQGTFYKTYISGPRQGQAEWGEGADRFGHHQRTQIKTG